MTRPAHPIASVVVPTRDRPAALARCLEALAAQTMAEHIEIVVVDDASARPAEITSIVSRHRSVRLLQGPGRGPATARNIGGRAALGSFLCFTDDDCAPAAVWVERLVETLREGADAAAGTTVAAGGALAEASEIVAQAPAASGDETDGLSFAPSNNLACTSEVFAALEFDESYPHAAGEDREWCVRLVGSGYALRRSPEAEVVHHAELSPRRFLLQQIRYGRGAYRFRRLPPTPRRLEPHSFYVALVRRAFARGSTVGLLVCMAQIATAAGFVQEWAQERRRTARGGPIASSTASTDDRPRLSARQPPRRGDG